MWLVPTGLRETKERPIVDTGVHPAQLRNDAQGKQNNKSLRKIDGAKSWKTWNRGANFFCNPVKKRPGIRPKIAEIQLYIFVISVIREIRPKIFTKYGFNTLKSDVKPLKSLKFYVKSLPGIWPKTLQIRPEIPEIL